MDVVVRGAARGVGHRAVRRALQRGHAVVAVARRPLDLPGARSRTGDVRDAALVEAAAAGAGAARWCVGVTRGSGGDVGRAAPPGLLAAVRGTRVRRVVGVSGAGAALPRDPRGAGARLVPARTHRPARDVVQDAEGEHRLLVAAGSEQGLDWTRVRPPRLLERPGTGCHRLTARAPGLASAPVAEAGVALAVLPLAEDGGSPAAAPHLVAAPR